MDVDEGDDAEDEDGRQIDDAAVIWSQCQGFRQDEAQVGEDIIEVPGPANSDGRYGKGVL